MLQETCLQAFHGGSETNVRECPRDGIVSIALMRDFGEDVGGNQRTHDADFGAD